VTCFQSKKIKLLLLLLKMEIALFFLYQVFLFARMMSALGFSKKSYIWRKTYFSWELYIMLIIYFYVFFILETTVFFLYYGGLENFSIFFSTSLNFLNHSESFLWLGKRVIFLDNLDFWTSKRLLSLLSAR
jgi:hypothetical protein